eukprot:950178_1
MNIPGVFTGRTRTKRSPSLSLYKQAILIVNWVWIGISAVLSRNLCSTTNIVQTVILGALADAANIRLFAICFNITQTVVSRSTIQRSSLAMSASVAWATGTHSKSIARSQTVSSISVKQAPFVMQLKQASIERRPSVRFLPSSSMKSMRSIRARKPPTVVGSSLDSQEFERELHWFQTHLYLFNPVNLTVILMCLALVRVAVSVTFSQFFNAPGCQKSTADIVTLLVTFAVSLAITIFAYLQGKDFPDTIKLQLEAGIFP